MIGELLIARGALTRDGLAEVLAFQSEFGGLLGQACLKLGLLREDDLIRALSFQLDLPILGLSQLPDTQYVAEALQELRLNQGWLIEHGAVVWKDRLAPSGSGHAATPGAARLCIVARNPISSSLREEITKRSDHTPVYFLASNRVVDAALDTVRKSTKSPDAAQGDTSALARLRQLAEEAPVIEFVSNLFSDALEFGASDVHVEPEEFGFRTRFRIDGVLGTERQHPRQTFDAVVTRIKILSGMDIAERRLPQDGRQGIRLSGQQVDLRVSALPGAYGESIVVRLLRKKAGLPDIQGLGLMGAALEAFRAIIAEPNGIVLVTGPTGSGKSTTLYRVIEEINNGERKIITIEDPIEYESPGVTQVQARPDIGLTFAGGLRAMLRQDPDVIMVGEIRDAETALIATQAALTGHLVLSTLHTNSAVGAIERLVDLDVEPFLIEAALRGVIGQRLVRSLCPSCKQPAEIDDVPADVRAHTELVRRERGVIEADNWCVPVGCDACDATGYKGRIGVFEILDMRRYAPTVLRVGLGQETKSAMLRENGYRTMAEDASFKASLGLTSLAELYRVFGKV
jgi:general secretion pathway protein E